MAANESPNIEVKLVGHVEGAPGPGLASPIVLDPNSMSIREIMVGIVIPRIEGIDQKLTKRLDDYDEKMMKRLDDSDTRWVSIDSWRSKVNGAFAVIALLVPVIVGLVLTLPFK